MIRVEGGDFLGSECVHERFCGPGGGARVGHLRLRQCEPFDAYCVALFPALNHEERERQRRAVRRHRRIVDVSDLCAGTVDRRHDGSNRSAATGADGLHCSVLPALTPRLRDEECRAQWRSSRRPEEGGHWASIVHGSKVSALPPSRRRLLSRANRRVHSGDVRRESAPRLSYRTRESRGCSLRQ